jgi:hypothetical protein
MARGTAKSTSDKKVIEELAAVNAKIEAGAPGDTKRLELLRRQATLGDARDAAVEAARRRASDSR